MDETKAVIDEIARASEEISSQCCPSQSNLSFSSFAIVLLTHDSKLQTIEEE